jgi:flavin reductase (DIM6/NTAB) family NADH-FMN oxidoreductase RutF
VKKYIEVAAAEAWRLVNHGPLVLVCTKSAAGKRDLAPIAWSMPVEYDPVSEIGFVCDKGHATAANILASGKFALALPHSSQKDLVMKAGELGGAGIDKFEALGLGSLDCKRIGAALPEGIVGWLECELLTKFEIGTSWLFVGKVLYAACDEAAWKGAAQGGRLLVEKPAGKTLHHLGGSDFTEPGSLL